MQTRSSFQRGWVEKRKRQNGWVWLMRYRIRDASKPSGWRIKAESLRNASGKKEALQLLEKRMREINESNAGNSRAAPLRSPTFSEFATGVWNQYLENRSTKPSTRCSYESMLRNYFLGAFGSIPLHQITPIEVSACFHSIKRKRLAAGYRLNLYALLRTMFEVALEHDLVLTNPVRRKLHRPEVRRVEKPTLSAEEIGRILANIPEPFQALFLCLAVTGLRIGEVLALRWMDLDWKSLEVKISQSLWRGRVVTPKTEGSATSLHLPAPVMGRLLAQFEGSPFRDPDAFIFCKADGSPQSPGYLRKQVLYPAMEVAGIQRFSRTHGFHLFRHSAASIVHGETRDLKLTQELLRHARMSTTANIYIHSKEKGAEQATETLARLLAPYCSQTAHFSASEEGLVQ